MAMTAREAAWTALQRWRKNGAWSDAALNIVLQNAQLAPRDAALAARICYGTLQNLTLLDHYLAAYCTTPLQKLEPKVLDLLRLSAYQIVLLDKVPPRAAVNEAVALCRKGGCARAAGLVNAVLRRVAEHRDALPEIPGAGTASYLAVRSSHPQWLAQMLIGKQRRRACLPAGQHPENNTRCPGCVSARRWHRDAAAPVAAGCAAVPRRKPCGCARLCRRLVLCAGRGRALRSACRWCPSGDACARCLRRAGRQKLCRRGADARSGMYDFLRYTRK